MFSLRAVFWMAVVSLFVLNTLNLAVLAENHESGDPNDIHGGVTMGVSNAVCDDAKANIGMDWDPNSTEEYTCSEDRHDDFATGLHSKECEDTAKRPLHICYPRSIVYTEDLPTSGSHRPLWPKYGEYSYIPPQRWIHNLEHGAIVFLYHPCANADEIAKFKAVARHCLYRHTFSAYKKLPPRMNFALLAWRCKLVMSSADVPLMVDFIKNHALKAPERTSADGQYEVGLLSRARIVSDQDDSELCPGMNLLSATANKFKTSSAARRSRSRQSQARMVIIGKLLAGMST